MGSIRITRFFPISEISKNRNLCLASDIFVSIRTCDFSWSWRIPLWHFWNSSLSGLWASTNGSPTTWGAYYRYRAGLTYLDEIDEVQDRRELASRWRLWRMLWSWTSFRHTMNYLETARTTEILTERCWQRHCTVTRRRNSNWGLTAIENLFPTNLIAKSC